MHIHIYTIHPYESENYSHKCYIYISICYVLVYHSIVSGAWFQTFTNARSESGFKFTGNQSLLPTKICFIYGYHLYRFWCKEKTVSVRYTPKKQNQQSNNFQCNDFSSSLTLMILIPESPLSEPFLKVKEGSANIYSLLILKTHSIPYNPILP